MKAKEKKKGKQLSQMCFKEKHEMCEGQFAAVRRVWGSNREVTLDCQCQCHKVRKAPQSSKQNTFILP